MMNEHLILKIHFAATLYMLGLICLIQAIHYPLFSLVGEKEFVNYHKQHIRLTSFVIAGPMLIELFSAIALFYVNPALRNISFFSGSFLLLIIIWAVTFLISIPQHDILATGFEHKAWSTLTKTNWIRTVSWGLRSVIIFQML
ncbi:MAG: hypothetical protein H7177_12470 [Rhizobacter sp.]|nr:hypothetical protein [Bacteriovorax sp.]